METINLNDGSVISNLRETYLNYDINLVEYGFVTGANWHIMESSNKDLSDKWVNLRTRLNPMYLKQNYEGLRSGSIATTDKQFIIITEKNYSKVNNEVILKVKKWYICSENHDVYNFTHFTIAAIWQFFFGVC